jgi:hypothetical protein
VESNKSLCSVMDWYQALAESGQRLGEELMIDFA